MKKGERAGEGEDEQVEAKTLAQLGAADFLAEVWGPDLRPGRSDVASSTAPRSCASAPLCATPAVFARNLVEIAATDLFGREHRRLLSMAPLPEHKSGQVDSLLRLHDALQPEVAEVERRLARDALGGLGRAAADDHPRCRLRHRPRRRRRDRRHPALFERMPAGRLPRARPAGAPVARAGPEDGAHFARGPRPAYAR